MIKMPEIFKTPEKNLELFIRKLDQDIARRKKHDGTDAACKQIREETAELVSIIKGV